MYRKVFSHHLLRSRFFLVGVAIVITILAIYLTPLKNFNLVEPHIKDIDPTQFYNDYKIHPDNYVFIDVRPAAAYTRVHAQGAINIELYRMYNERYNLPKHGKTIVLICSGGLASGVAYMYLEHYGFQNLRRIEGGIENWQFENLPVVTAQYTN